MTQDHIASGPKLRVRGDVETNRLQCRGSIQIDDDLITPDRFLEVFKVLSVSNAAVSRDPDRQNTILVFLCDHFNDLKLIQLAAHGTIIGAGLQDHVWKQRSTDSFTIYRQVHSDVAQFEGHDRRVGNDNVSDHVRAIRTHVL